MKLKRIEVEYWKPGTDYLKKTCELVGGIVRDGDILSVSEKAISIALGNIVDEEKIKPKLSAKILSKLWMRIFGGYFLGYLCRLKTSTIHRLRMYPFEGARHKQVALRRFGILQALRFGSEGGMDASNLPYSYAALPLPNPLKQAEEIHKTLFHKTGKKVTVLILDSDKTYSFRSLHLSPTKTFVKGLFSGGGFLFYFIGRFFKLKPRSTPKAIYPPNALTVDEALTLAETSHHFMGHGGGKTVWDVAEKFNVYLTGVTWDMLGSIKHHPIVVIRRNKRKLSIG